ESAEDVRVVLEPRNRTVEAEMLMEQLFRQTDLEVRISLNMNVLDRDSVPRVMDLKQVLQAFLDHRMEVLERRSRFRLEKIAKRLEVLEGYLVAYLNLDEVIRIIREEDEPKQVMMRTFNLTEAQTEAILNMRLRSLRKLEEFEIRKEHDSLTAEKGDLEALLADEARRWSTIATQIAETRKAFGPGTPLGDRRTELADAPSAVIVPIEAFVEREPITLILSEKGWIRAMKGHTDQFDTVKFKEGDQLRLALKAETTDKLLVFTTDGRFYTIGGDKLPSGRGFGEPLRLMIDMANEAEVLTIFAHKPGRKLLLSSSGGRGFIVEEAEVLAQTKAGKSVLNLGDGETAAFCLPAEGDAVAILGDNRKLLVFMAEEIPVMARGRGVMLQKYRDGGVADIKVFNLADGLSWKSGERTRTEADLTPWLGKRASVGRLPPTGFPRVNKFT
ncbi:MAG: DNA topoisomerase IV subunit A, partial [Magnetospirillum sp.]|nr:DNA topoisomerase IV subunit A [Magnetospirillum sp.]